MNLRAAFISVVFAVISINAHAADPKEIESKVAELNSQSIKLLGVSLNAVRYLVGASPSSYLLYSYLESSGEIAYVRELEAKGYVKVQVVQSLPDGTQRNEKFLRVIPVGDGAELQRCVVALEHNPAVQGTLREKAAQRP